MTVAYYTGQYFEIIFSINFMATSKVTILQKEKNRRRVTINLETQIHTACDGLINFMLFLSILRPI